ncbi:Major Facilitator Superfamily transporter [Brachybacterium faecium DSM 4810]|uniref:Major Facilitator Superfamily transporter n=1 Tax=Brachybacterium faecium (strain ATCC 43885 / DSM 4810 / JCM 11609 / LMG 19847 / NBRC 14762 / NCIMB 9860 / 6-10) TaxID=446465 RepID=C7MAZ8_BRAFD|nr:MFS transporter [Brachybacterium faecium]ACU86885.1 Major Facilitator Superfamily transporter [Brachybacterium faecium DSM 4810]
MNRLLVPTSALMWGLQIAFLSPSLALILATLYGAGTTEIGWVLAIYNASGFLASLVVPAWADRRQEYLGPMLLSGVLTVLLVLLLALVTTLPLVTIVLVVVGGPAGVGVSLLWAHLRHAGARPAQIVNTRAIVSVAWVAGPPLATLIIGWFGPQAILLAIALVALANIGTTMLMIRGHRTALASGTPPAPAHEEDDVSLGTAGIVLVTAAFVLLQATNATAMSFLAVYVPQTMGADVVWAGVALGVAAGLEVPALMIVARLTTRHSSLGLILTSCVAGIAYYLGVAVASGPILLIALQVLNAWCFAGIGGVGLTLFQQMIRRPGLSTGLYMNTRRVGAILSGPLIVLGGATVLGQRATFLACALLTLVGLLIIAVAGRRSSQIVATEPASTR